MELDCKLSDKERIKNIKKFFIETAYGHNVGHLPSALSSLEVLYVLYNKVANITKENLNNISRDRVILSKEHAKFAQACVLYENGLLDKNYWDKYFFKASSAHDIYNYVCPDIPAMDIASGSLGHGLGVACGLGWDRKNIIYVIVGDGELQEGSCFEALMFIAHNNLNNIVTIIDSNKQQIDNYTKNIIDSSSLAPKAIQAMGFEIFNIDGTNLNEIENALIAKTERPKCIISNTIKGKEIFFKKNKVGFAVYHWTTLNEQDKEWALSEIEND